MTEENHIDVSPDSNEVQFICDCGWTGPESSIDDWSIQKDRDRVVRVCPGCETPAPEWGTFSPIDAVVPLARDGLQQALDDANITEPDT